MTRGLFKLKMATEVEVSKNQPKNSRSDLSKSLNRADHILSSLIGKFLSFEPIHNSSLSFLSLYTQFLT